MPHFFLPINWLITPLIIISALVLTTALIYWATPNLKFPYNPSSLGSTNIIWSYISERKLLFSIFVHLSSKQKDSSTEKSNRRKPIWHLSVKQAPAYF